MFSSAKLRPAQLTMRLVLSLCTRLSPVEVLIVAIAVLRVPVNRIVYMFILLLVLPMSMCRFLCNRFRLCRPAKVTSVVAGIDVVLWLPTLLGTGLRHVLPMVVNLVNVFVPCYRPAAATLLKIWLLGVKCAVLGLICMILLVRLAFGIGRPGAGSLEFTSCRMHGTLATVRYMLVRIDAVCI